MHIQEENITQQAAKSKKQLQIKVETDELKPEMMKYLRKDIISWSFKYNCTRYL